MSLQKKIILSFLVSFSIIVILGVTAYVDFIKIKEDLRYLELADSIRSKSLQLRRHEKNFLLYGDLKEAESVYNYFKELKYLIKHGSPSDKVEPALQKLEKKLDEYKDAFERIDKTAAEFHNILNKSKGHKSPYSFIFPFVEATFLQHPLEGAELLRKISLVSDKRGLEILRDLSQEINSLRGLGEEILILSKDIDKSARERAEGLISISQKSALILIPSSFLVGLFLLFVISQGVVNRLRMLMETVEKTGKGHFSIMPVPAQHDEVSRLISTFNRMEDDLKNREEDLKKKEEELLQSKKLAAIGTLASGVAHELNNPLNNIYISAQVLQREAGKKASPFMKETLSDIISQSIRVKGIVSDLLEFARGRDLQIREVELNSLITAAYKSLGYSMNLNKIRFVLNSDPNGVVIYADPEQLEQVFINLFTNAFDAMNGKGGLTVHVESEGNLVRVKISDTGRGMSNETKERVFEPFFTTKDKGTGLGLAIVFNIIKKHNGEISVESEEDKGATFTIILPMMRG